MIRILLKQMILLTCIMNFQFNVSSQTGNVKFNVRWGQPIKINKKFLFEDIVTIDRENNIHVLYREYSRYMGGTSKYHLARVSNNLNYTPGKELVLQSGGNPLSLLEIVEIGGKVYVFTFYQDNRLREKYIYLHEYNSSGMTVSAGKEIAKMNFEGFKRSQSGKFSVVYSEDRNSILVYFELPYADNDPERFGAIAYDRNMNVIWENTFSLPYQADKFRKEQLFLGNNGELYMTGRKYLEKEPGVRRDPKNFQYVLLHSANHGTDLVEHVIALNDYYITDLTAAMTPENDIVCSGFFSEKQKSFSIKGVFYILVDVQTKRKTVETVKEFDYEFITEGLTEKQQKRSDKNLAKGRSIELPDFEFRDIILKENGGVLLTAEQFFVRVVSTTDSRTGIVTYTYYYYYNDIIIVDIDSSGKINWTVKIPKNQVSSNDFGFYSSFLMAVHRDKIYLIFNDHLANANNTTQFQKLTSTRGKKNIVASIVTIDRDGTWKKQMLFPVSEPGIHFLPKYSMQISEDEILLYCYYRGSNRFGKLSL